MSYSEELQLAFAGRYAIESEIGEGGSAHVFAAHDLKHDREVAIKILKASVAQGLTAARFLREIRVDAGLQHPRILPLYDSGEVLGVPYFVMPLVTGASVRALLQRQGTLPVAEAVSITTQVADALHYLHARGFLHRDVKPENILWQDGNVWLADFGIVRAIQDASTTNITLSGTAVGTPSYMSPEQRMGVTNIDGRSDQYSLACVLYEMLVGHPPQLLDIAAGTSGGKTTRVTPVRSARGDVSPALDKVLARALSFDENERWPTVHEFAQRLVDADSSSAHSVAVNTAYMGKPARVMTSVALLALAALGVGWWILTPTPTLDAMTVAVLPLAHEGDENGQMINGDDCSRFLRDAVGRWTGIRHVDDMRLRDVRLRRGRPESLQEAMEMARQLGAGLAVWGVLGPRRDESGNWVRPIRVFLYDANNGSAITQATGMVQANDNTADAFQILVDSLLIATAGPPSHVRVSGSRDYAAVRSYLDGHRALDQFDLSKAVLAFRNAVEVDSRFGLAYLWLAWSTLWLPESRTSDWGAAATRALVVGSGLTGRDSVHARALMLMHERQFAQACELLRELTVSQPTDFAAWYGLGECLSTDVTVEPSEESPSGWRFRTSIHEAIGAYEKAVELVPSFTDAMGQRAQERIARWLFVQTGRYRPGLNADSTLFAAWPSLDDDTLAFIPFPERSVFAGDSGTRAPSYHQALQRNRDRALALVNRWVRLDSSNVLALETLALAREANDELMRLRRVEIGLQLTGVDALQQARSRATGATAIRLAAINVRFLIKTDRYADAKRLADSLLQAVSLESGPVASANWMYGLAMLTGRARSAVEWGRRAATLQARDALRPDQSIPAELSVAAADAATYSALGAPADSIRRALSRTESAIAAQIGTNAEFARQQYVEYPLLFAWPAIEPAEQPSRTSAGNRWLGIQLAIARGDTMSARREMWQADSAAMRGGVAEVSFEIALLNSRIWLALGDTVSAQRVVSTAIDLVRISGDQLMRRPTATASFVRLLIQRAALADSRGNEADARLWGTRAALLWRDADTVLESSMRPILRWRNVQTPGGFQ